MKPLWDLSAVKAPVKRGMIFVIDKNSDHDQGLWILQNDFHTKKIVWENIENCEKEKLGGYNLGFFITKGEKRGKNFVTENLDASENFHGLGLLKLPRKISDQIAGKMVTKEWISRMNFNLGSSY